MVSCAAPAAFPDEPRLPADADAIRRGAPALADVLPHIDADDPDLRLRARRLARRIARAQWLRDTPRGAKLVLGRVVIERRAVRSEGGLYLGAREVTLAEWRPFAARARGIDATRWRAGAPELPVTDVSLREARAYAATLGARLPTAPELALAASAGGSRRYPWGDRADPALANTRDAGRGRLLTVGGRPKGASRDGVEDLVGNAAEWTETPDGRDMFAVVGGSYRTSLRAVLVRRMRTYQLPANGRLPDVGFRVAYALPPLTVDPKKRGG